MYDQDYEDFLREQAEDEAAELDAKDRATLKDRGYTTKDSGKRFQSPDGMVRDTSEGKPQFTLLFPKGVPFEDQLMTRVADLYHRGGVKYGARNWEKSSTEEALAKHEDCLMRHVIKFLLGVEDGEDHAAAVVWNVNAVDLTRRKIREAQVDAALDKLTPQATAEPRPHNHDPLDFKAGSYSGPDCGCGKNLPKEDKPFPKVEFSDGDQLLDKNCLWWQYSSHYIEWFCTTVPSVYKSVGELAYVNGPLMFQNGAYAGITMLKDGSLRWG